jgi:hypothetical protein
MPVDGLSVPTGGPITTTATSARDDAKPSRTPPGGDDIGRTLLRVANRLHVPAAANSLNYLRLPSRISDVVGVVEHGPTALADGIFAHFRPTESPVLTKNSDAWQ